MFKPKIFIPSNVRSDKKDNVLITDVVRNKSVNLLEWLGIDLLNGDNTKFLSQKGTYESAGGGTPSAPINSVQYNNAGSFGGDANFTRNPTTFATVINALSAPTVGGIFQLSNTILQIGYTDTPSTINSGVRFNSTSSAFRYTNSSTDLRILANGTNLRIGDTESTFNDTLITLDDINKTILAVGDGVTFGIGANTITGNKAFLATTADGDNIYGVFNDKTTGLADHLTGFYSLNPVTGQGAQIFAAYDGISSEHGLVMNWDSATPTESTRFTSNSDGIRFLNQTTLDVFFQVDITGNVVQPQIGTYLNDAAAAIGNVPINGFYRETATGYVKARVS
jgi:hypothetical protein